MREVDLNRLQIFKVVVLSGSFSKAGLSLKMPKSRISRQISALEKELGVPLIYRTTRSFQLTAAGRELFQRALPVLTDLESVVQAVGETKTHMEGTVRFTVPEDVGVELMAALCHEFMLAHPKVEIDLIVENRRVDLVGEGVDLALRIGKTKDSTLTAKKVGEVRLGVYASPLLFQRFAKPARIDELKLLPFLSFFGRGEQELKVKGPKGVTSLRVTPIFNCNNFFVLKKMALAADGFALIPSYLVRDEVASGALVPLFRDWKAHEVPVQLIYPPQKNMPARLRTLIDFMARRLAEKMA